MRNSSRLRQNTAAARKKNRFSKGLVVFIVAANVLFTVAVLYVFLRTGAEPVALVTAWFGFTLGELWTLAGIKKSKQAAQTNKLKEGLEDE